jgi:hypothetical protein
MKPRLFLSLAAATTALAQQPAAPVAESPAAPVAEAPATTPQGLTVDQQANVLKQLEDLERSILAQRGTNIGAAIAKIRSAASSDAAAMSFLADCDQLVNVEWKEGDRDAKKAAEDREERSKRQQANANAEDVEKNGDTATGLRLALEYLALSLEARDVKNLGDMAPKLLAFHQSLISAGPKLRGRTGDLLMRGVGGGGGGGGAPRRGARFGGNGGGAVDLGVVMVAYQLDAYLDRRDWPNTPGDIISHYEQVIIKGAKSKDQVPGLWDAALQTEATFRKERMFEGEFKIWQATDYPELRWRRAVSLVSTGPSAVTGMAEMLKVIKEFPNHASSPGWVKQLRLMVKPDAPTADEAAVQ